MTLRRFSTVSLWIPAVDGLRESLVHTPRPVVARFSAAACTPYLLTASRLTGFSAPSTSSLFSSTSLLYSSLSA
jgi:hypothetical protein